MAKDLDLDDVADGHYLAVQELAALRQDAERWRKLRDTPATSVTPGPLRGWLFSRPGGADSLDRMADALPAVGAA